MIQRCPQHYIALLTFFLLISCADTSLREYVPKNSEEAEILSLLVRYQDAKNQCNVKAYLACLHDSGRFHFGRGSMISKKELETSLPAFWSDLKSGNPAFYPMNREMITGNYIRTGRFINPRFKIHGNAANITMTFTKWGWHLRHYVTVTRTGNHWLINRLDWETN